MAGEVAHVVYGESTMSFMAKDMLSSPSFWSGVLFPDIRHLGIVSRRRTHPENVSLDKLTSANEFETGMRVHAWTDEVRSRFLHGKNIKETLRWHPFVPHALKLVEDELLYDRFDDWNLIHRALSKVHDEELQYVNSSQHVITWHNVLQDYFRKLPTDESRYQLSLAIGLSKSSAEEVNSVVKLLQSDERAEKLIASFENHLKRLLQ